MIAGQAKFMDSEAAQELRGALQRMAEDSTYNTDPTYISNAEKYPGNNISFVDKHMLYISQHPKMDPQHYLANLKLMTRLRK